MLAEFDTHRPWLSAQLGALERSLRAMLEEHAVQVQLVAGRVKDRESLRQKLARPDRTYLCLWDVTDLVGLRIVTYFEEDVELVARLIEGRFAVDFRHSTDKQRFRDAGRFGYRSLHYVCAVPEGAPDDAFRFEIQVRTVLQHAWAEIEHDLGYKADAVPSGIRRRFARVASLLEVADDEFVALRRELGRYQRRVREAVGETPAELAVDVVSLDALTRHPDVARLDAAVARATGRPESDAPFFPRYLVRLLARAGLGTAERLLDAAARHGGEVEAFAPRYFEFSARALDFPLARLEHVQRGYGLLFLGLLTILRAEGLTLGKVAALTALYADVDELDERKAHALASALVAAAGA